MWTNPSYTYYPSEQKRLEQTQRRGRRLSILGLFQPLTSFVYGLAIGSINQQSYLEMMDNEARVAAREFAQTGRIRVIVQDNGSVDKSIEVQRWREWESLGLYIFFLPKHCS